MSNMSSADAWAAEAVRQLRDEHGLDYSYAVTEYGTLLDLELPALPWMPGRLMDVMWRWDTLAKKSGFPGLQGVLVVPPATTERIVGAACSEWIRCLIVGRSLIEFNEALEAAGLFGLTIGVDVLDVGDTLHAIQLAVTDKRGHVARLFDVPVVSKRRRGGEAVWQEERLVEQLAAQLKGSGTAPTPEL
jgi:hypothetical protein